jgi:hypothetical protein
MTATSALSNTKPSGRLKLTWANIRRRLIARECGEYAWVPHGEYRAREVRLLHEAGTVGGVAGNPSGRSRVAGMSMDRDDIGQRTATL